MTRPRPNAALRPVAAIAGMAMLLAACGVGGGESVDADDAGGGATTDSGTTDGDGGTQEEFYAAAIENGGTMSLFIGTSGNEATDRLVELFNETYPDVTIEYVGGTGAQVTERLLTEKRAGLHNADALLLPGVAPFAELHAEGYLDEFVPEGVGLFTHGDESTYIENVAYSYSNVYNAVCFNPVNVSEEDQALLDTYEGWTDPTWKGRASIVNPDGFGYRFGLTHWLYQDEDLGKEWLAELAALEPVVFGSANIAAPRVIAGEYDVVFNAMTIHGARAHHEGAPLECKTGEYAPYYTYAAGLPSEAPNEPAGRLFLNWIFSEEGQLAVQETNAFSARREGVTTPVVDADWWYIPDDVRATDEALVQENYSDLVATFEELFGAATE